MSSIYQRALGSDFSKLHPEIQKRFGFSSKDGIAAVGRGVMRKIWHGAPYTLPFLMIGAWRNIMFPQQGTDIPFMVENYPYIDEFGRETVTWVRTYRFPRRVNRFDATMIYSEKRGRIVDYLGNHQHLAVDIDLSVDPNGGLHLRSEAQRFYEGPITFDFPMSLSGDADVHEWYDDTINAHRISVRVSNPNWGDLFGYEGEFQVEYPTLRGPKDIPLGILPVRTEPRE